MNPARDVDPGPGAPKIVTAVVEIPKGSQNKYELDEETGMLRLARSSPSRRKARRWRH